MNCNNKCPQTEDLRQLLNNQLSSESQEECTAHLDHCSGCQQKLEEIATEGTNLSSVVEHLTESVPMATSAYWPALREIDAAIAQAAGNQKRLHGNAVITPPPRDRDTPQKTRKKEAALDFLDPPTDPSYLGRLAHFDVMRVLGRGGMGVVLEAFDSKLQRHVAIKVLDPEVAEDELGRQRFCREARSAASVTHENVVAVHQVEKVPEKGIAFLVMQLISGETLEQRMNREKILPINEIVRISMEAARGLAAAHAQGLIHRDVKPGNILLEPPTNRVKLTDFGLARITEDVKLTRTGYVSGTPLYMAPEQALGAEPDPRSDLFSLGAVMYEMAAGQTPFTGSSALAILKQITEAKHKPLREVNPNAPVWLAEIIDDLLAKKPADRYDTAADLAEVLEYHWAHLKTSSEELPAVCQVELRRRSVRNRLVIGAIGAALLVVGLVAGSLLSGKFFGGQNVAPPAVAKSDAEPIAILSANAGSVWSVSFDPQSETVVMGTEDGSVRLWDVAKRSIKTSFKAHRGPVWHAQFSDDGGYLITTGDDSELKIWNPADTTKPLQTYKSTNAIRGLAISRDGEFLYAGGRDGSLQRLRQSDLQDVLAGPQENSASAAALSADGKTLAIAGSDPEIQVLHADSLSAKFKLRGHAATVYGLAFNTSGTRLASVGWDKTIRVWDLDNGLLWKEWDGQSGDLWAIAYSPDGAKLATAGQDGSVKLWAAESGKLLATYLGHESTVHTVAFNQAGTMLISGGRDGSARIWPVK